MANIGFTTGSLYRSNVSFDEGIRLYHSLGANAIELSFATPTKLLEYNLGEQSRQDIKKFAEVSIHAPWKEVRYDSGPKTQAIINKLKTLYEQLPIKGLVLHPDTIDDFEILDQSGLPFLLENMDKRKSYGIHPDHFRELKSKYNFGFVLDVEHAYEHDSSMNLAKEFIKVMGDRLKHMHVSGYNKSEIHVPTYQAINKKEIGQILKMNLGVPIILEGILLEDVENSITKELEYIRSFEKDG
jgi:endonuclease IV